jgi:ABC-2 type transport system permease protein
MEFSWPRLRAQIVKELLSLLRDPRSRFVLVGPPLLQLLIFSFAVTLEVKNVDIAVLDRDAGGRSQALVSELAAAGFTGELIAVHDRARLQALIDEQRVLAALEIPADFSRALAAGRPAELRLTLDGRRANAAQILTGYIEQVTRRLGAGPGIAIAQTPEPAAVRHWFNPNLIHRWYVVPGLAGILSMLITLLVTALSIARERELGTFDQLLVSPAGSTEIIVSKTVPAMLVGSALGLMMVLAGIVLFGVPFTGSFLLLLAGLALHILSVVGIGLMISAVCATQQQAILGTFAVAVPMVLMSGFATPVENMPLVLQWLAEAIPLKHFLIIVQGCFLKAMPAGDVFDNAWPLAVIAAVTITAATRFVRARLQ